MVGATEVAISILRIDDVLWAKQKTIPDLPKMICEETGLLPIIIEQIFKYSKKHDFSMGSNNSVCVGIDDVAIHFPRLYMDMKDFADLRGEDYGKLNKALA